MLTYFPTPYPDEIWLSVLWRYQIRCGDSRAINAINALAACPGIARISAELPEGSINAYQMILEHSLFPYYSRIRPFEEKLKMLSDYGNDTGEHKTSSRYSPLTLKYCPYCIDEDIRMYGESYWHREHQLPYIPLCHKHKIRLLEYRDIRHNKTSRPILPEWLKNGPKDCRPVKVYDNVLTDVLYKYLTLPLETGPDFRYSILYRGLEEKYGTIKCRNDMLHQGAVIYADLISAFGEGPVKSLFGNKLSPYTLVKIRTWQFRTPERYAFLSALINQPAEETFVEQHMGDFDPELYRKETWQIRIAG